MIDTRNNNTNSATLRPHFTPDSAGRTRLANFLDEAQCRRWVIDSLHPAGPRCPGCSAEITNATALKNFYLNNRRECKSCGHWFSATTGTFLQGTRLSFRQLFLLAALADFKASGLDTARIATAINISPDTVRIWDKRFDLFR